MRQGLAIGLRVGARTGHGANVGEEGDGAAVQERDEFLDRTCGVADGEEGMSHSGCSALEPPQCFALMEGDVIGLVALDLLLRIVRARVVRMALVVDVLGVHAQDTAAHPAGLGIPADVIAAVEGFGGGFSHGGTMPERGGLFQGTEDDAPVRLRSSSYAGHASPLLSVACRAVARGDSPPTPFGLWRGILLSLRERRMVGTTGIEPVTPTMSR